MAIEDSHYVIVGIERPQRESGVERIGSVIEYDGYGKEVKSYPELTYNTEYFGENIDEIKENIKKDIAEEIEAKLSQIEVIEE